MKLPGVPVLDSMGEALSKAIPEKVPASPTRSMHPAVVADNPQTGRAYDLRNFWAEGGGGAVFGYDGWAHSGPTGAGVGDPLDRDPEMVRGDVLERVVSLQGARKDYGVVIDPESLEVDLKETGRIRKRMRGRALAH